jgi:hypothetical protein
MTTRFFRLALTALTLTTALAAGTAAGASTNPSFPTIVRYMKQHGICTGLIKEAQGNKVSAGARKDHVVGALSCETAVSYISLDYFASAADLHAVTSSKGFLQESTCRSHKNECAVASGGQWLFIGLLGRTRLTQALIVEKDLAKAVTLMTPAKIARG